MLIENIKDLIGYCIKGNLPFYCYRKPGDPLRMGIQRTALTPLERPLKLDIGEGFVAVPFNNERCYHIIKADLKVSLDHCAVDTDDLKPLTPVKGNSANLPTECNRELYVKKVEGAIGKIKEGLLEKVVYSHPEFIKGHFREEAASILKKLLSTYPDAYIAMVNLPGEGLWMCATPELLLSRKGQGLQTIALAGTRSLKVDGTPWDEKNKEEQQIVERYIVSTLQPYCTSINTTPVTTTRAGHLEHLLTRIGMKLPEDQSADRLLQALHPTPAVCGTPKDVCYHDILSTEGYDREYYSGCIGHINNSNDFALYVNLRCMKLTDKGATLYAGGGITAESDPTTEWEETKMKIETLKRTIE